RKWTRPKQAAKPSKTPLAGQQPNSAPRATRWNLPFSMRASEAASSGAALAMPSFEPLAYRHHNANPPRRHHQIRASRADGRAEPVANAARVAEAVNAAAEMAASAVRAAVVAATVSAGAAAPGCAALTSP